MDCCYLQLAAVGSFLKAYYPVHLKVDHASLMDLQWLGLVKGLGENCKLLTAVEM